MTVVRRAQQARAVEKKRQILDAAVALMFEKGVPGVTHRQVAARAQVPVGSIGYYYNTREDLLVTAVAELGRRRRRDAETILREVRAPLPPEATADLLLRIMVGEEPTGDMLTDWLAIMLDGIRESEPLRAALDGVRCDLYLDFRVLLDAAGYPGVEESRVNARVGGVVLVSVVEQREDVLAAVRGALVDLLEKGQG